VSTLLYRATVRLSRVVGMWIVRVMGAIIAAAYYSVFPRHTGHGVRFPVAALPC
jgi:hypothetical protein